MELFTMMTNLRVLLVQKPDFHLKRALRQLGYAVDTADSAVDASEVVLAANCDVVVLDLELPGIQGLRFVKEWRSKGITAPVLALSSRQAADEKVKALNVGADALLAKPYDREEVVAQVKALLRRTSPPENAVVQVGDLEIDTAARVVKRAGRTIRLTRREYALLQYLAANRGKIVSQAMILANLFQRGEEPITSNVVAVHIYGLRAKIDKGFDQPLIVTRYGEGYSLRRDA
jgi:DNA-binding response OmpR family regulator